MQSSTQQVFINDCVCGDKIYVSHVILYCFQVHWGCTWVFSKSDCVEAEVFFSMVTLGSWACWSKVDHFRNVLECCTQV